jgi:cytidylate kinase
MIKVITVEREYGSQGAEFAHHLAEALGWKLIDSCLIDEIARRAGVFGKAFWHGSIDRLPAPPTQSLFDSEKMTVLVRDYLLKVAAEGNAVIVGRGAACVLSNYPGAFHMFVYASRKRKLLWFQKNFPDRMRDAEAELDATDKRREEYVRRFYDQQWDSHRLYHLMLNSCMGFDAMLKATVEAAGLAAVASTAGVAG